MTALIHVILIYYPGPCSDVLLRAGTDMLADDRQQGDRIPSVDNLDFSFRVDRKVLLLLLFRGVVLTYTGFVIRLLGWGRGRGGRIIYIIRITY